MENDLAIAEQLLAAARRAGADAADVIVSTGAEVAIGVADRALEEAQRAEAREAGLRVLTGRRQACVASSDLSPDTLSEMAARAVAIAREAPEDPWCALAEPEAVARDPEIAALELADPEPAPGPDRLEALALEAEAAALAVAGVTQVEQANAASQTHRTTLAASNGFAAGYLRTFASLGAYVMAGEGLGRESGYASETRCHIADLPTAAEVGALAGRRAVERLGARKPPGGAVPVLFDERVARGLIGHLVSAANGAAVARGASWLLDAMDRDVLPGGMTLVEEPLRVRGTASRPFDAEGIATATLPIVQDGRLTRWILDLASARKLGLETTGNARRGLAGPPAPGVTNLALTEGGESRDDLIRAMGTGLLVTSLIGASINPTTGAYSRGAYGFWIEGGEIAYPVNEVTIAGSLPEIMRTIRPANDGDPQASWVVPSLLVEGLIVGA